jgi:hypothetical protein
VPFETPKATAPQDPIPLDRKTVMAASPSFADESEVVPSEASVAEEANECDVGATVPQNLNQPLTETEIVPFGILGESTIGEGSKTQDPNDECNINMNEPEHTSDGKVNSR